MAYETHIHTSPAEVVLKVSRWDVTITVTDAGGTVHTYVASADSFYTEGSQIFFGTEEEYKHAQENW